DFAVLRAPWSQHLWVSNYKLPDYQITRFLPINLSQDNIYASNRRHHIREQSSFTHLRQSLHICQASRTHMHAVGFRPTVADNVVSHFAARRFDCLIYLALGDRKSFRDDLEVVD